MGLEEREQEGAQGEGLATGRARLTEDGEEGWRSGRNGKDGHGRARVREAGQQEGKKQER